MNPNSEAPRKFQPDYHLVALAEKYAGREVHAVSGLLTRYLNGGQCLAIAETSMLPKLRQIVEQAEQELGAFVHRAAQASVDCSFQMAN